MQKNIRWIAAALAFLIAALAVFAVVNDILRIKVGAKIDMIHSFYEMDRDTVDVLCLGSSHCYHSIQPNELWGNYGISSYVLSSPRQSVPCSYYLLKEALGYQKPKVVLLETYCFRYENKYRDEESLRLAIDGMRLGKVKMEMLEDFFGKGSWKKKLPFMVPFLLYHARWSDLQDKDFIHDRYMKGGILDFGQEPQQMPQMPERPLDIPEVTAKYLEKMIGLCRENGISLVLFAAPFADTSAGPKALRVNLALEEYAVGQGIPFLFYQKTGELEIDYAADFYDSQHLNTYGTAKLTRKTGEWLQENYVLADHRQEEAYESWNADYVLYEEALEKRIDS